jgi:hypothetical protein
MEEPMRCGLISCYFTWGRARIPPKPFKPTFGAQDMQRRLYAEQMSQLLSQQHFYAGQQQPQLLQQQGLQNMGPLGGFSGLGNALGGILGGL